MFFSCSYFYRYNLKYLFLLLREKHDISHSQSMVLKIKKKK